ncbi:hypothetical protein SLEP1_g7207 [Rubroshorea leprosula]|uniref:Uncharacterized protein n=1 Tax=Rubroshorea leprosula TaxID=152421 RepID=A0AAV5I3G4_9ROSI|nr:hypothetical protein SLEP1_g7207 [Rubroshorea leprosula]
MEVAVGRREEMCWLAREAVRASWSWSWKAKSSSDGCKRSAMFSRRCCVRKASWSGISQGLRRSEKVPVAQVATGHLVYCKSHF